MLKFQEQQNRVSASNDFFRGLSKDADLVMDGDLLMVSMSDVTLCFVVMIPSFVLRRFFLFFPNNRNR